MGKFKICISNSKRSGQRGRKLPWQDRRSCRYRGITAPIRTMTTEFRGGSGNRRHFSYSPLPVRRSSPTGRGSEIPSDLGIETLVEFQIGAVDAGLSPPAFVATPREFVEQIEIVVFVPGQVHAKPPDSTAFVSAIPLKP